MGSERREAGPRLQYMNEPETTTAAHDGQADETSGTAPGSVASSAPEPFPQQLRSPVHHRSHHARRNVIAVAVFLVVVLVFTSTFRLAVVRGDSMLPTYRDGQMVLVNKIHAVNGPIQRGDVVLVGHGNDILIKRVAFLPGDTIPPRDNWMFRRVAEFFDIQRPGTTDPPMPLMKVPPGFLVVLGDNRRVSEDSRAFGPVKEGEVIGRVVNAPPKP